MAISTFLANKILDHMLRNQAYTPPANVYLSYHNGDPGDNGANEIGSTTRQAIPLAAASAKATTSSSNITHTAFPAASVSHFGIWDAATSGNFLWGVAGTGGAKTVNSGDTFTVPAGDVDISFA